MSNISIYTNAKDNSSTQTISMVDFLQGVKFGKWQTAIETVRLQPDKKLRNQLKETLPCVTISGAFGARKEAGLIAHSSFICIDIDGYSDKTALLSDPYTYALFKSASGNGLACVIKINPAKHKDSFRWIRNYYFNTYGIVVDPAPQNVASLRYVSFDAELQINEKSKVSKTQAEPKHKPNSLPVVIGDDVVSELIKTAVNRGINLAPTYQEYFQLAFALAAGFGENGRQWFHALCAMDGKYNSAHADRQYTISCQRNTNGITVGTLYWMLKQAGIDIPSETKKAVQIASIGKRSGRTQDSVAKQLVEINGYKPDQAAQVAKEVFERNDLNLQTSVAGDPERLIESLMEWVNQNHPLRKNTITRAVEDTTKGEINKERLNSIYLRARAAFNIKDVTFDLCERIIYSDFTQEYNPITEYIEKNRYRNTTDNITKLCRTIYSDTPFCDVFMRKWLIGIIAAYNGHPVRYVLALVGGQFTGKTTWFRGLLPEPLQKYYAESKLDRGKDDELLMCQKLIVMDDEMGGKSKQDEKQFKELTSKSVFSLRAPYGRGNEDFKRLAILCGTSNDTRIINDRTGNTRILTVEVVKIDHEEYNSIDKNELFMELVRAYESGESWQLTKEDLAGLAIMSKEFEDVNTERELILQFFHESLMEGELVEKMTATQIKDWIEQNSKQQIRGFKYFGLELKKIFGTPIQDRGARYYSVIKKYI
jgi:hypothetical protein